MLKAEDCQSNEEKRSGYNGDTVDKSPSGAASQTHAGGLSNVTSVETDLATTEAEQSASPNVAKNADAAVSSGTIENAIENAHYETVESGGHWE